jgi:hypothetical protein
MNSELPRTGGVRRGVDGVRGVEEGMKSEELRAGVELGVLDGGMNSELLRVGVREVGGVKAGGENVKREVLRCRFDALFFFAFK